MMTRLLCSIAALLLVAPMAKTQSTPRFIQDSLQNYITKGMKDWNIPGLAIAIVKDGQPVIIKGFGVSDIDTKEPVNEHTLFMIASNSKLFTGTALAQMETNGKIKLDDKVVSILPQFQLFDPVTTNLVTVRDMLTHRIGTHTFQGDFVFWGSNLSPAEIMYKMKLLKPTGLFRQQFGYCNSCFLTAGQIIPRVTGKPWEVYVYDSLVAPLGMHRTYTLSHNIGQVDNASKPYTTLNTGTLTELPYDQVDNLAPAGSMISNAADLSKWLLMQLDSGRLHGRRIVAWEVLRKTRDMNIAISSRKSSMLPTHFNGYGLGVFVGDYAGRQVYSHTGGAFGFVTNTCFVPEEKLGIAILTNNDNQSFFEALRYQVLDAYLGVDWVNRSQQFLKNFQKEQAEQIADVAALKARVKGANPPQPLSTYTGTYTNPIYGEISIENNETGKALTIVFKGHKMLKASLAYMDKQEWLLAYNHPGFGIFPVKFAKNDKGSITINIRVNDFLDYDAYTFTKQ